MQKLKKVNWHYTDRCNFSCRYCFIRPLEKFEIQDVKLLNKLAEHFDEINFVGGEPTLVDNFNELIQYAKTLFKKVTMVTNGLIIANESKELDLNGFSQIGVSIDFFTKEENIKIGRCRGDESLDINDYQKIKNKLSKKNIEFKINLMISKLNYKKDFNKELELLRPHRLKVLGVMAVNDDPEMIKLAVTSEEFNIFIKNHPNLKNFTDELVIERPGEMINAYYMVTGDGHFFTNNNFKINKVGSVFKDPMEQIIEKLMIDDKLFNKRYKK